MKKVLCIIVIMCMLVPGLGAGADNSSELMPDLYIDGLHIYSGVGEDFLSRDGILYVPVRCVFDVLDYITVWNEKTQTIILYEKNSGNKIGMKINSGKMYSYINGEHEIHIMPERVILEENHTYIPVKSVCEALRFDVIYDADLNVIRVNTYDFKDYAYDDWEKYRIASADDISKDEYITNREVMYWFSRYGDDFESDIKYWYGFEEFAPLDDVIDDELKGRIISANFFKIINEDEILSTDFDAKLTNYEALRYAIRRVPDVGGCVYDFKEYYYTEKSLVYERAFCKGLIDKIDYLSADEPILRKDFYNLMYKTLYVRHYTGGYGGATLTRGIDDYLNTPAEEKEDPEPDPEAVSTKIDVDYRFDDALNISWTLPDTVPVTDDIWYNRTVYTADGTKIASFSGNRRETEMNANELISYFAEALPDRPDYIRCTFSISNEDYKRTHEWYFDIDLSDIKVEFTDKKIVPGTYTRGGYKDNPNTGRSGYLESVITLADGYKFTDGAYYVIESYDKTYRRDEYNLNSECVFIFNEQTKKSENTFSGFVLRTPYTDEMHLREIIIEGNAADGFTLKISPESEESFAVVEN